MSRSNGSAHDAPPRAPHDLDAERGILGAILLDNTVIPDVTQILKPEDFYQTGHQVIFQAIIELVASGLPVELTLLVDKLRTGGKLDEAGGYLTVAGLEQFVMTTTATGELADLVAGKSTLRRLMTAAETIFRDCAEQKRAVDVQIDLAQALVFDVAMKTSRVAPRSAADQWQPTLDRVQARKDPSHSLGVRCGLLDLDSKLILDPTSLTIIGARPSIGKTAFGLNIARNITMRAAKPVLFFSLEMGSEQLMERIIALHTNTPLWRLKDPTHLTEYQIIKLREREEEIRELLDINIVDETHLSLIKLSSLARQFVLRKPCAAIVVDYLGLMDLVHRDGSNRNLELGELSRGLKNLAMELRVPIIALHQLSRDVEKRGTERKKARPRLSDLRESGHLEEDADNVLFLHRDRQQADSSGETDSIEHQIVDCEIIVAKQRNGAIFNAQTLFDLTIGLFLNKEKDGAAEPERTWNA